MNNNRTYYSREAEMRADHEKTVVTLIFLAFGLGVGTALALLFAPHPGKETRDELAHAVEEGLSNGREAVNPTLKRLEKEFAELRKKVDDRISEIR
jgi:gas vesicle protein